MKNALKILFLICLFAFKTTAIENQLILKIDKPGFVPVDSVYQISLLLSSQVHQVSSVNFYLFLDEGVNVKSIKYSNWERDTQLDPKPVVYSGYFGKTVKTVFSDYDSLMFHQSNSQLLIDLQASYIRQTEIAFAFELVKNDTVVESYSSFNPEYDPHSLPIVELEFYMPQKVSGECLRIPKNSKFSVEPDVELNNNELLIGFWAKLNADRQPLLNIINNQFGDTLFSLSVARNQTITVPDNPEEVNLSNLFISRGSWNYYSVIMDYNFNEIKFLLNGVNSFSIGQALSRDSKLSIELVNRADRNLLVDNFGVYDFAGKPGRIKNNLNYMKVISDSSRQIYFQSFDNLTEEQLINYQQAGKPLNKLDIINSDAPIFSRLPELYIKSFENFNEVLWKNSDDKVVDYYILEKSVDGTTYTEVGSKVSDSEPEKEYSILDQRNTRDEIVYYRIKLVNKDESVLYSPVLKVGQAQQENFMIEQNYPNPFNPVTTTTVEVLAADQFSVVVYDLVGNKIETIYSGVLEEGIHKFDFDGSKLPSGIYFLEVSSRAFTHAIKMILAK